MSWWRNNATVADTPTQKLKITASNGYDKSAAKQVPINSETPLKISSDSADIDLLIRIKGFIGADSHSADPSTSPYFDKRLDTNISIQVNLTPKREINGNELVFGNDFGYPIRDFLPYGTSAGLTLFQKYVDPSVQGDLYCDDPYLYGKALSSFNVIKLMDAEEYEQDGDLKEGISYFIEEQLQNVEPINEKLTIPAEPYDRQRLFQDADNLKEFKLLPGKAYLFDFFSGLVSLKDSQFNINLPGGFKLNLSSYLNEKFNTVRYVLKRQLLNSEKNAVNNGEVLLVVNFEIVADTADVLNETLDELQDEGDSSNPEPTKKSTFDDDVD